MTARVESATMPGRGVMILPWVGAAALLMIPFVAMKFTREVQWSAMDFIAMGTLLVVAVGSFQLLSRQSARMTYRIGAAVAVFAALFLIWVNLAVGIIGSEDNDANMMYAGVIAVAVGGACIAHGRARGMACTMIATAAAQVLVAAIALAFDLGTDGRGWPRDVIGATIVISTAWLVAAWLFRRAARP